MKAFTALAKLAGILCAATLAGLPFAVLAGLPVSAATLFGLALASAVGIG